MIEIRKKILTEYFNEVVHGNKNFEIRKDTDNISVGDILVLMEWDGNGLTGQSVKHKVKYVLRNKPEYGLMPGYVVIGW